ncbi:50S ribosomal protein L19, partial [Candidatus Babeliales bacterium]|nr:50S ribosomal protein L19 [Candidatus Babeliales bacterium]
QQGRVRRAKLYYLRDRIGKAANVKPKIVKKTSKKKGKAISTSQKAIKPTKPAE